MPKRKSGVIKFIERALTDEDDVSKRQGPRAFPKAMKDEILSKQDNKCARCGKRLYSKTVKYDHIVPYSDGGKTIVENGEALCPDCHAEKTARDHYRDRYLKANH